MNNNPSPPSPRAAEVFSQALDITDPQQRGQFLDQACQGDPVLRQQVDRLLAHHKDDSFLEHPAAVPESTTTVVTSPRPQEPGVTLKYFGDYELLEEVARGGMGVVWKARQKSLNRTVAVKMILGGQLATEADVKRFHTEAEAAANLKHPNIVAIHEIGEHEGRHYFSMDLIEGQDLARFIDNKPMPAIKAAELLKTVCEAVHYAHQRGTLHRDLKPQNILMDAEGRPHITDFGLAKQMTAQSDLTQDGTVMGSPSYMPPEQATGKLAEIGPASDVYSLGAMLYQMLTGKVPFVGATPLETLRQVMEKEPVAPSKVTDKVPSDLETICLKCLEKKPERRYASARALAEELDRFLKHEPILAKPASASRKVVSWCRQRPWLLTGLLAVGFLLLAGLALGLWEHNRLLQWQAAHPGKKPGARWWGLESEIRSVLLVVRTFVLWPLLTIQYLNLWERRLKRRPISSGYLTRAALLGTVGVAVAIAGVLADLSNAIWWRRGFPPDLSGSLGISFPICWLGVLTAWEAMRGKDQFWFGGSPDDLNPAKQLSIDGVAWLLAIPIMNALLYFIAPLLISAGQFQSERSFLSNGIYLASPEDEAKYHEGLRTFFLMAGMWVSGLPTCWGLWRNSRPPWRDVGPVAAAFCICMSPIIAAQMPALLFWTATTLGLLGGWLIWRLAPLRPVKEPDWLSNSGIDKRVYLLLLLLSMVVSIGSGFGIHTLIRSKMPGGITVITILAVAHWPLARGIWKSGQARGRLFVAGCFIYLFGLSPNQPGWNPAQVGLGILVGALMGTVFHWAMLREKRRQASPIPNKSP